MYKDRAIKYFNWTSQTAEQSAELKEKLLEQGDSPGIEGSSREVDSGGR